LAKVTKPPAQDTETPSCECGIRQAAELIDAEIERQEAIAVASGHLPYEKSWGNYFSGNDMLWMVPWKEYGFDYCGVYIIGPENRWPLKIGISERAYTRVNTLQTAHWSRIDCHGYWICENRAEAAKVEKKAHDLLKDTRHLMGEWFDVDVKKAAETILFAAQSVGVEMVADLPKTEKFKQIHAYMEIAGPSWRRGRRLKIDTLNVIDLRWAMNKPYRERKARGGG
jgi:hypothetical protein